MGDFLKTGKLAGKSRPTNVYVKKDDYYRNPDQYRPGQDLEITIDQDQEHKWKLTAEITAVIVELDDEVTVIVENGTLSNAD